jgi:hypothetical protein
MTRMMTLRQIISQHPSIRLGCIVSQLLNSTFFRRTSLAVQNSIKFNMKHIKIGVRGVEKITLVDARISNKTMTI